MNTNAPTILIGLGGLGGQVVNNIYGRIPAGSRSRVAIHAFDTDVNSLQKLEHLKDHVTQTSSYRSVGEYLAQNEMLLSWFPDNPQLRRKTMTEGAGQIRSVSRLAFRAAMDEGKMNSLWESINSIFPVQRNTTTQGVRIIIISSLAGGTGSGIFLQIAMYLREVLERQFGQSSVLIRGAFLLPDILVRSGILDQREWESVQANGYACLKELNAITLSAAGKWNQQQDGVTIELEYRPNQVDLEGRMVHAVTEKQLPYDFCFLYDYENLRGQHLNGFGDYLDMVARTIYLQLFSPISAKHFSQEDNQILELIGSDGRGRYCGAGVATLTYPYEDIVEYCALKRAVGGLDDAWLYLDKLYDEELDRYENDLRRGIAMEKPDRGNRYIWHLDQLVGDDKPHPFFTQVYRQVREELDKGKLGDSKAGLFIRAVEDRLNQVLENDAELKGLEMACRINEGKLGIRDQIKQEIGRVESSLGYFLEQINKKIYEYRTFVAHQVIEQDADAANGTDGQDYRLNTWFLTKPEPVHPIAVRYMLYQIRSELRAKINSLREQNQQFKRQIDKYQEAYSLSDTDLHETAMQRVDLALKQNLITSLYKNQLKDFKEEYLEKATRQLSTLNKYKKSLLLQLVFTSVVQALDELCADWERFFEHLKDTRTNLLNELARLETKYELANDPTKDYVLASKTMLEKTWEQIRRMFDNGVLPADVSAQIYLAHYHKFCRRNDSRLPEDMQADMKVEALYRERVLAYVREDLKARCSDRLDIDVISALQREALWLQSNAEIHIRNRTGALEPLAGPFIPEILNHRELKFWGIHPDSLGKLPSDQRKELFREREVQDGAFSRYELVCYRAHYGLSVQDFEKFSAGERAETHIRPAGAYYESYKRRVDRLNRGEPTVTPHLDKRWHVPAFMPDLNPKQAELDNHRNDRALLLGFIFGYLELVNTYGKYVYQYNGGNKGGRLIYRNSKEIEEEIFQLHHGLLHNPIIYEEIIERAEEEAEQDLKRCSSIQEHRFIKGAANLRINRKTNVKNILDAVLLYESEGPSRADLPEKGNQLRLCLLNEIESYFIRSYGQHRSFAAKQHAAEYIEMLWEESAIRETAAADSAEYSNWRNMITNKVIVLKA